MTEKRVMMTPNPKAKLGHQAHHKVMHEMVFSCLDEDLKCEQVDTPKLSEFDTELLKAALDRDMRDVMPIYTPPSGKFLLDEIKRESQKIAAMNDSHQQMVQRLVEETLKQVEAMTFDRIMELLVSNGYIQEIEVSEEGFFRLNMNSERDGKKFVIYERRVR